MGSEKERRKEMGLRMRTCGLSTLSVRFYLSERRGSEAIYGIISRPKREYLLYYCIMLDFF